MTEELDIHKAMRLIEIICCEYCGQDNPDGIENTIYKIAHCFSTTCKNPHNDWKEELILELNKI